MSRRTLVKGVAWGIPIVATSVASPAFAASMPPTIKFDQPSYSVAGCDTLTGVSVTVTKDGINPPTAGTSVTVKLPAGFTFSDGSSSTVLSTDGNGQVLVPPIKSPASASQATITATSLGVTAQAAINVTAPVGADLYMLLNVGETYLVRPDGLPSGYAIQGVNASSGTLFVTLADGSIWAQREAWLHYEGTWFNTGLKGDVLKMHASSASTNGTQSLVMIDGVMHTLTWDNYSLTTPPVLRALSAPAGGTVVRFADSTNNAGSNSIYVETMDGKLWSTPSTGSGYGTWTEITGFPTPVKDWVAEHSNNSTATNLYVIGNDGKLYEGGTGQTNVTVTSVTPVERNPAATWTAPAVKFSIANDSMDRNLWSGNRPVWFVDAKGGLYDIDGHNTQQNVNLGGVFDGQLTTLDLINTASPPVSGEVIHIIKDGRLYSAGSDNGTNWAFKDITPPDSLLKGATIVEAHSASGGLSGYSWAIDSTGKVWVSNRYLTGAATWSAPPASPATTFPADHNALGIVQNGQSLYVYGGGSCAA